MPLAVNNQKTYDDRERRLFSTAEVLRTSALVLAIFLGIIGLILGVNARDYHDDFSVILFLTTFVPYGVAACIIWDLGRLIALLLESFADMHYYARISAAGAEISASAVQTAHTGAPTSNIGAPTSQIAGIRNDSEWKCHTCGRVNKVYVTTCSCGQKKSEN
ncbi:MAG: hypothetical protein ACI4GO_09540 [Hominenteromicrobium sp.]